jgi:hypothetical protein
MISGNTTLLDQPAILLQDDDDDRADQPDLESPLRYSSSTADEENLNFIKTRYLSGEYKIILQLLGVLENGRLAKRLTDQAVDACEHVQNLRDAIYDYKQKVESLEPGSKKVCCCIFSLYCFNYID